MAATEDVEDVGLAIDGKVFRAWEKVDVKRSLDTFSTTEFSAPFEPERKEFRDTFRPFKFQKVTVQSGDQRLFTGSMLGVNPDLAADKRSVSVTCYAAPAVLHDCTEPASSLPLEFKKLKLQAIAAELCRPFGLEVDFRGEDGAIFDKVKIDPTKKIFEFIVDVAQHRSFVFTDNTFGQLLCWRSTEPGKPVARLREGEPPLTNVEPSFSPQDYFSEITGFGPAKRGRTGSKFTVQNPWLPDVLRPHSFRLDKIEKGDVPEAVNGKIARMFADMVSYKVDVATWRQPDGEIWRPNTTVTLFAPSAMVYREFEFLVRDVTLSADAKSHSATLNLILPGVFSGKIPEKLPWDEPD